MMNFYIFITNFIIFNYINFTSAKSKPIILNINSRWLDTPILAETSEYFASENEDKFWNFINEIQPVEFNNLEYNNQENYDLLIKISKNLLNPQKLSLLKFTLSVRSFSPKVQMHIEIAKEKHAPMNCESFVEINNLITCEISALNAFIQLAHNQSKPLLMRNDHRHPSYGNDEIIVVLYSQIGSNDFKKWHTKLVDLSEKKIISYFLRHYVQNPNKKKTTLSGYGVELAIKNTEYKAKDDSKINVNADVSEDGFPGNDDVQGFMFAKLRELHPNLEQNLKEFRQHLIESQSDSAPLKVWQLQDLSYQAGQLVASKPVENQLTVLKDISQNFPSRVKDLIKVQVNDEFRKEVVRNQRNLESSHGILAGESALFINGRQADLDIYDVFNLLESIKSDGRLMDGLHSLTNQFPKLSTIGGGLLMLEASDDDENSYAVDLRSDSVQFINDLEKDRRYLSWPSSVQDLLRPSFPGMLRHIRKNIFNMVVFMDPSDKESIELAKTVESFYIHNAPVRIGLVFVVKEDDDTKAKVGSYVFSAFQFISKHDTAARALSFLTDILDKARSTDSLTTELVKEYLKTNFGETVINDIQKTDSEYLSLQKKSFDFYSKLGFTSLPQVLINGIPLKASEIKDDLEESVVKYLGKQTSEIQKAVYNGFLKDDMDMFEYIMTRKHVMPRLNSRVLSPTSTYLDLMQPMSPTILNSVAILNNLDAASFASAISATIKYLSKNEEHVVRGVSHWIVADLDTKHGRNLLSEAIKQMKHTNGVRIGIIHSQIPSTLTISISKVIQVALTHLNLNSAKNFISKLLKEENVEALMNGEKILSDFSVGNMNFDDFNEKVKSYQMDLFAAHELFVQKILKFPKGALGIVTNGRILGPLLKDEQFIEEDFTLLEKYTLKFVSKKKKVPTATLR